MDCPNSPIVKPDNSIRIFVNCDKHPFPKTKDLFASLGGGK